MFSAKKIFASSFVPEKPKITFSNIQNIIVTETIPRTRATMSMWVATSDSRQMPIQYEWYKKPRTSILAEPILAVGNPTETTDVEDGMSYRLKVTDALGNSIASPSAMLHFRSGLDGSVSPLMTGGVWGCGSNLQGAVGVEGEVNVNWLFKILGRAGDVGRFVHVSSGSRHGIAIRSDGKMYSWGNSLHLAGRGSWGGEANSPEIIGSETWKTASAGGDHSIAIKDDGSLWGWGSQTNLRGGAVSNVPQLIDSGSWRNISAGGSIGGGHDLAIKQDGTLWAWGKGEKGQLGLGSTQSTDVPAKVGNDLWKWVSAGHFHSLGIKNDGTMWAWGENSPSGKLGTGDSTNRSSPALIDNGNWLAVAAGLGLSLAIKSDGTLWAWGFRIGDKTRENPRPKMISSEKWIDIAAGSYSAIAMKNDGSLWTWGENGGGQLSNAHMSNYTIPTGGGNPLFGEVLEPTCVAIRTDMINWFREGVEKTVFQNLTAITMDCRAVSANSNHIHAIY